MSEDPGQSREGPDDAAAAVRIDCLGHAAITGGDTRILEIIDAEDWSRRPGAVGYAPSFDPQALLALRGRVLVTLSCGAAEDRFETTLSPQWQRSAGLVFRKDTRAATRALGVMASKAAADLEPALLDALRAPGARLEARLTPIAPMARTTGRTAAAGALTLVALPIGHQGDLSPRALEVLMDADLILAEDTRVAAEALRWRGVKTKVISCHRFNEQARSDLVRARLAGGGRLALVSDAGFPSVSDPGETVVRAALEAGAEVTCVPGPSAVLAALALSGLPTASFRFAGFPPRKGKHRAAYLERLATADETTVLFESAHRIADLLAELATRFPERPVALARDLTKRSEALRRATAAEVAADVASRAEVRGEYTLVVGPAPDSEPGEDGEAPAAGIDHRAFAAALVRHGCPARPIVRALQEVAGLPRAEAYDLVQALKDETEQP